MTRGRNLKSGSVGSVGSEVLLELVRELLSRNPEYLWDESWEPRKAQLSWRV